MLIACALQPPLGYALAFGIAGHRGFGIVGIGLEIPLSHMPALVAMAIRNVGDADGIKLRPTGTSLRLTLLRDILSVGLPSSLNATLAIVTVLMVAAFVAPYGVASLAGYGLAARLDSFSTPLTFGLGSALTVLVGQAIGSGDPVGARRVAYTGAFLAVLVCGVVDLLAGLRPAYWADLLTTEAAARVAAAAYLSRVAPAYPLFGLGLSLSFALQGAARVGAPLVASIFRPLIIAAAVAFGAAPDLPSLYGVTAAKLVVYGLLIFSACLLGPFRPGSTTRHVA